MGRDESGGGGIFGNKVFIVIHSQISAVMQKTIC